MTRAAESFRDGLVTRAAKTGCLGRGKVAGVNGLTTPELAHSDQVEA